MKKYISAAAVAFILLFSTAAFAITPYNNQNQGQYQEQGQDQSQLQGQAQGQQQSSFNANNNSNRNDNTNFNSNTSRSDSSSRSTANSASLSGASARNTSVGKVNTSTDVNVSGDENKTYANAWPSLSGQEGVSQGNMYTIFGGMGNSETELYKVLVTSIQSIEASKYLTSAQKKLMVNRLFARLMKATRNKRLLGVGPETSGKNLLNLGGLLAWDSFWNDGQRPFQSKNDTAKEVATDELNILSQQDEAAIK